MGRPNQWDRIKNVLIIRRASVILIIGSFIYGIQLILHPDILYQYEVYKLIREMFQGQDIGFIFIVLSIIKLTGIILNHRYLKMVARTGFMFVWFMFMVAFKISPPPNTVWILALVMVLLTASSTLTYKSR